MDESRRDFLKGLGLAAGAGLLGLPLARSAFAQPPGGVGVRRNVMDLAPDGPELADLRRAVEVLRSLAPSDRRSWYGQAEIHLGFCPHGNWFFLPWHRAYLAAFERLCRAACGNPAFMLPYWDWTTQRSLPPPFFQGVLADCSREIGPDDEIGDEFVGPQVISDILDTDDFLLFASAVAFRDCDPSQPMEQRAGCGSGILEGTPHNAIHRFVGGDMGTFLSPLDPIFWLHHANVDRLWTEWNRGHANTDDARWLEFEFSDNFIDAASQPVSFTVLDTLSTVGLGYRYDTQPLILSTLQAGPIQQGVMLARVANDQRGLGGRHAQRVDAGHLADARRARRRPRPRRAERRPAPQPRRHRGAGGAGGGARLRRPAGRRAGDADHRPALRRQLHLLRARRARPVAVHRRRGGPRRHAPRRRPAHLPAQPGAGAGAAARRRRPRPRRRAHAAARAGDPRRPAGGRGGADPAAGDRPHGGAVTAPRAGAARSARAAVAAPFVSAARAVCAARSICAALALCTALAACTATAAGPPQQEPRPPPGPTAAAEPPAATVTGAAPATLSLKLPDDLRRDVEHLGAHAAAAPRPLRLAVEGLPATRAAVALRAFVNLPTADASTPLDDPHYAGTIPLAAASGGGSLPGAAEYDAGAGTALLDLAKVLAALPPAERLADDGTVRLTLVAVPLRTGEPLPPDLELPIGGLRLDTGEPGGR